MTRFKLLTVVYVFCVVQLFGQTHHVDKFTGDFSYQLPLITVPHPEGEAVSVVASYRSGIGVHQKASEIGLGWDIYAGGSIKRMVVGYADDWKNKTLPNFTGEGFKEYNGVFYANNTTGCEDFSYSTYKLENDSFPFPTYDQYYVSGGVNGMLVPFFDKLITFRNEVEQTNTLVTFFSGWGWWGEKSVPVEKKYDNNIYYTNEAMPKPVFRFEGDFQGEVKSQHYPEGMQQGDDILIPDDINGNLYSGAGYSASAKRLVGTKYVEFFTNQEIVNGISGFIEAPGFVRNATTCDLDGIGAFRITGSAGNVYHYSLPVYEHSQYNSTYPLDNNYAHKNNGELIRTKHKNGGYVYKTKDSVLVESFQPEKVAVEWKLVAVTGANYVDANSNGAVDEGDRGYWITYDYGLWADHFKESLQPLGSMLSYQPQGEEDLHSEIVNSNPYKSYLKQAVSGVVDKQIYYLNSIKTPTHTAIFIRELRNDEHGAIDNYEDIQQNGQVKINIDYAGIYPLNEAKEGMLYDNGGPNGYMFKGDNSIVLAPEGADKVELYVEQFQFFYTNPDEWLEIYDGDKDNGGVLIGRYGSNASANGSPLCYDPDGYANATCQLEPGTKIISTQPKVTIRLLSKSYDHKGFAIRWRGLSNEDQLPKVTPQLRLAQIVLLNNVDFDLLKNPTAKFGSGWNNFNERMSESGLVSGVPKIYHTNWYENNKTYLDNKALKSVMLESDYHLAKGYYGNILAKSPLPVFRTDVPKSLRDKIYFDDVDNSGKLSLNRVVFYENNKEQLFPSYVFDYANGQIANPDYSLFNIDQWGYYNYSTNAIGVFDYSGKLLPESASAWSLRRITTPMGGSVNVTYEVDKYNKVIDEGKNEKNRAPMHIYPIKSVTSVGGKNGTSWQIELEGDQLAFNDVMNNYMQTATNWYVVIPFNTAYNVNNSVPDDAYMAWTDNPSSFDLSTMTVSNMNIFYYYGHNRITGNTEDPLTTGSSLDYMGHGYIYIEFPENTEVSGGGIRTKSVMLDNSSEGVRYTTAYEYINGVASNEMDRFQAGEKTLTFPGSTVSYIKRLKTYYNDPHKPHAQVGYSEVREKYLGAINTEEGYTSTLFNTELGYRFNDISTNITSETQHYKSGYAGQVEDFNKLIEVSSGTMLWGAPMMNIVTDSKGNIISKSISTYEETHDGSTAEIYHYERDVVKVSGIGTFLERYNTIGVKRNYPVRLIKQEVYSDGMYATTDYLEFDKLTGSVLVTETTDPINGKVRTELTPMHAITAYEDAGPKCLKVTNDNILGAIVASKTYINGNLINVNDFASASFSTYTKQQRLRQYNASLNIYETVDVSGPYWYNDKNYVWTGNVATNGVYRGSSFVAFDPSVATQNSGWRLQQTKTMLDDKGHVLETKAFNDRFTATRFGYEDRLKIAEAANCNYKSFTYCGFENRNDYSTTYNTAWFEGEVQKTGAWNDANVNNVLAENYGFSAHSGQYVLKMNKYNNATNFARYYTKNDGSIYGLQTGRRYRASVWVHDLSPDEVELNVSVNNTTYNVLKNDPDNIQAGDWIQLFVEFDVPDDLPLNSGVIITLINGTSQDKVAYFDDLQFYPLEGGIKCYVYNDKKGFITEEIGSRGFVTHYEYDNAGRVVEVWQEFENLGLKRVSDTQYHFMREGK